MAVVLASMAALVTPLGMVTPSATAGEPAEITADIPSTLAIGETADVTGSAQIAGQPAPSTSVFWDEYCLQGDEPTRSGQVMTSDDGTFSVHVDPGRCAKLDLELSLRGSDLEHSASIYGYVEIPWHVSTITMESPTGILVGDEATSLVTVARDGQPAAGLPVHLSTYAPFVGNAGVDGVTDANGQARLHITFGTSTVYDVYATTDGDDDTLSSSTHTTWVVGQVQTSLSLTAPDSATVGDDVTVQGSLTRGDDSAVGGISLDVSATDEDAAGTEGAHRTSTVTTDEDGTFVIHDQPVAAGSTGYVVSVIGTSRYTPALATTSVPVTAKDQAVTLSTDRTTYHGGDHVALHVGLSEGANSSVLVTAETADDSEYRLLYEGPVPAEGLTLHPVVRHSTTFSAVTTTDPQHTGSQAMITRTVEPRLELSLPTRSHPGRFVGTLRSPRRARVCVGFMLSRYRHGSWHAVHQASCRRTDDLGRAVWQDKGRYPTGTRYRIRASFRGDALNAATHSRWVVFRFR
jgi:hypothetical protein